MKELQRQYAQVLIDTAYVGKHLGLCAVPSRHSNLSKHREV